MQAIGLFTGTIDDNFGLETEAAVVAFQTRQGLQVNGVADPRTLTLLESARATDVGPKQIKTELQSGFYTGAIASSFGISSGVSL